ncbi:MAG: undecaprenyl-diphosphate phosphatase [Eubacteriales bacterium]|nr:undecaprenyl-diphosphate phosphatase [Eubacteriales bacterium]
MTIWIAMLLGLVQGIAEFLPVSSSGHLLLIQKMFGITEGALFFTVMLHLATLIAVFIVYWPTLIELIKHPIQKTVGLLIVATIPAVVIAVLSKKIAPVAAFFDAADAGQYLGFGFLLTSLLLFISDHVRHTRIDENGEKVERKGKKLKNMQVKDALIIGCMQGVGVLPGVSRSGSTISGALFTGLSRKTAADFSFLMSIPAIIGGAIFEVPDAIKTGIGDMHWTILVAGMLVAGITGYFAIKVMINAIKKKKLLGFVIYTAVLGALVLVDQFVTHYFF